MSLFIAGMGNAVPEHRIAQLEAGELARQFCGTADDPSRLLAALYRRTGVENRHSVVLLASAGPVPERQDFYQPATCESDRGPGTRARMEQYESTAAPLAIEATHAALHDAGIAPDRVTHLVTVSCSGFSAPGFDIALINGLQLSRSVERTHVGFMGCHGALNGLRLAKAFTAADPNACVLVCAVELCSLHQHYGWHPEQLVSNALFADGAAAVVGVATDETRGGAWQLQANGAQIIDDSADAMTWKIGDHGFEMTLSPRVPELIQRHLRPWLESWLASHNSGVSEIASWAIHPGGPRILSAVGEAIHLNAELLAPSLRCLADYGNMSSPTLLFILQRLRQSQAPRPCVALGFGPGLAIEAALFR